MISLLFDFVPLDQAPLCRLLGLSLRLLEGLLHLRQIANNRLVTELYDILLVRMSQTLEGCSSQQQSHFA